MKFTYSWLKEHLDTTACSDTIAQALTRLGLEVESVTNPGGALRAFRIVEVVDAAPHPNADKLRVCSVNTGDERLQIVCGAPNARAGMKAVLGRPGDYVPGLDVTLKQAQIRGVESQGMLCSARELALGEEHDGILDLPADAPVGTSYAAWAGYDDPLFDIAITPNRQDCLGVRGIARDLAAAGIGQLIPQALPATPAGAPCPIAVHLEVPELCPVFVGCLIEGVSNCESPEWLKRKLHAVGLRPISALVDITNLLSLDQARPLHVYDADQLTGAIHVRRGRAGETFKALDGKVYAVDDQMCVIADDAHVLGLGGIMGGEASGCTLETTRVFLEAAWFEPGTIAIAGRKLGILSDARTRFERGVDPQSQVPGIACAIALIQSLCGGTASDLVIAGTPPMRTQPIAYTPGKALSLGGVAITPARQAEILLALGFSLEFNPESNPEQDTPWQVTPPSWRCDIDGAADLVEEVLRVEGYDSIPAVALAANTPAPTPKASALQARISRIRRLAAARGWSEAITWSFIAPQEASLFTPTPWVLDNPISSELGVMRASLLPGLLKAARRNLNQGKKSVRLFEVGKRYLASGEHPSFALLGIGEKAAKHWMQGKAHLFDVYDAKAECMALLEAAGVPIDKLSLSRDVSGSFHPGQAGSLRLGPKNLLASFGMLHPGLLKAFDLPEPAIAVELYFDAFPAFKPNARRAAYAPPNLQPLTRDFAFVVPQALEASALLLSIRAVDKDLIEHINVFDVFTGPGVPAGMKSLAVSVTLQPRDKSLTDAALEVLADKIITAAHRATGATLRT